MIEINLESNKLTDFQVKDLFTSLQSNKSIKKLNLSKNYIGDASCSLIKQIFIKNESILELYFH